MNRVVTAIYLTETDVQSLVDMSTAIDVVEEAFRRLAAGEAHNVPRRRARAPGIVLHSMSAAAGYLGRVGWKQYTTTRDAARFLVGLYGSKTGQLEALIEGDWLGRLRTGAATGVAVRYLAVERADRAGLIGTGRQARTQLAALAAVRPLREVLVYSRDASRRAAFAREMCDELGIAVVPVGTPREAVNGLPIVVTVTASRTPVLCGDWLAAGATVCAVGSNALERSELDVETVRRAARIVCDSVEAARDEAGDLVEALEAGQFDWSQAVELAEVVGGKRPGRENADDVILFKSVGLALEDVALASRLVDLATQHGRGQPLPF